MITTNYKFLLIIPITPINFLLSLFWGGPPNNMNQRLCVSSVASVAHLAQSAASPRPKPTVGSPWALAAAVQAWLANEFAAPERHSTQVRTRRAAARQGTQSCGPSNRSGALPVKPCPEPAPSMLVGCGPTCSGMGSDEAAAHKRRGGRRALRR